MFYTSHDHNQGFLRIEAWREVRYQIYIIFTFLITVILIIYKILNNFIFISF